MHDVRDIEESLRTIRKLMERGQRYEAITARGGLLSGLLALAVAAASPRLSAGAWASDPVRAFLITWGALGILCAAWVAGSALRAARAADPEGRRISAQARAVGVSVLPAYVAAIAVTAALVVRDAGWALPAAWMLLHGVAILSTAHHAPRRLVGLGWSFLVAGSIAAFVVPPGDMAAASLAMGGAFGGLHALYGAFSLLVPLAPAD